MTDAAIVAVLREHGPLTAEALAGRLARPGWYVHYRLDGLCIYSPPEVRKVGRGRTAQYEAIGDLDGR